MKIVVLYVSTNMPGRVDAAAVFIPYAKRFAGHHSRAGREVATYPIPCSTTRPNRRKTALEAIRNHGQIDMLAYFGHGLNRSIQIGFDTSIIDLLGNPLRDRGCSQVVLYACSASASATGGFSAKLAVSAQCRVIGHTTPGHAVYNPYVRYHLPDGSYGWYVTPGSDKWSDWRKKLKTDFAYELPLTKQEGQG